MDHRRKRPAGCGPLERRVRHAARSTATLPETRARQRSEPAQAYATAYTQASRNTRRATTDRAPRQSADRAPAAEGRTARANRSTRPTDWLNDCEAHSDLHGTDCIAVGLTYQLSGRQRQDARARLA
jgi:hypothetical protein